MVSVDTRFSWHYTFNTVDLICWEIDLQLHMKDVIIHRGEIWIWTEIMTNVYWKYSKVYV
jgi:hypothetical protein